jgi:hypothetical protein
MTGVSTVAADGDDESEGADGGIGDEGVEFTDSPIPADCTGVIGCWFSCSAESKPANENEASNETNSREW